MNPECRAGKHSNCDEKGWRDDLGHIGPCLCGCHEMTAKVPLSDTDEYGRHGYLIDSGDKLPADLKPGDRVTVTPLKFGPAETADWVDMGEGAPMTDFDISGIDPPRETNG